MDEKPVSRSWITFAGGLTIGLAVGIPLGVVGLVVLMQIITVMISLP